MLDRILNNLHPAINKDPQSVNALQITGTGTAIIKNNTLQLIGANSMQFNLRTYTLGSLASAINGVSGYTATNYQLPTLSACVLLDGTYTLPATIPMFTSFLWQLFKPVALALVDALGAEYASQLEMILNTSDGTWLDSFGELFGVPRETGEPDQLYALRIFDLSVAPRCNNLAIQKALNDLGYGATITDSGPATFNINLTMPTNPPNGFLYSLAQLGDIVNNLRPAGVTGVIAIQQVNADSVKITENITTLPGTVGYGSGRKWGQGIWA
jgi:hypothetical protein